MSIYRTVFVYLGIAGFAGLFSWVYEANSHGVSSPWMTYLFAWPLLGGALPYAIFTRFVSRKTGTHNYCGNSQNSYSDKLRQKNRPRGSAPQGPRGWWAGMAYHGAVACATVGACVTGVFQIYGTSSAWVSVYWAAAILLAVTAAVIMVMGQRDQAKTDTGVLRAP